jgi:hypothetical protein
MGRACCTNVENRNVYSILVGRAEGKRPLERPRRRWTENIKINVGYWSGIWTGLIWLRIRTIGEFL